MAKEPKETATLAVDVATTREQLRLRALDTLEQSYLEELRAHLPQVETLSRQSDALLELLSGLCQKPEPETFRKLSTSISLATKAIDNLRLAEVGALVGSLAKVKKLREELALNDV